MEVICVRQCQEMNPTPEQIGPYRILKILGEGGMGEVYLAEQTEPFRRQVALKLIRPSHADEKAIHRFEAERHAMARMNHPNVAQVYEAGDTDLGQPYIAMEYVPGPTITDYCDRHRLSLRERLDLFTAVCDGIQHAHQKGLIHRDIKPGNILVTEAPGSGGQRRPVPKVIDFGIAKAMEESLTPTSGSLTGERVLGTPAYLSPEAFEVTDRGADLDTRSDVYALGIVLYELLVGELPFGSKKESFLIALQRAASGDPPAPSARFADLEPEVRETRAEERKMTTTALGRKLRGDLDWIVLKAIARQRSDRYVSAAELAEDIGRYRDDVPVVAGPPNRLYHARKFLRRHLVATVAAALVTVALVAGLTARTFEAARANREAERANREAEAARRYGAEADGVVRFLVDLFDVSDLGNSNGDTVTARELLEQGAEKVRREYQDQPLAQARLMDTMGEVYRKLGLYDESEPFLGDALELREERLGEDHVDVATSLANLTTLYWHQGRYTEAEPVAERALAIRESALGPEHPEVAASLDDLALVYRRMGRYDEAEPLFQRALTIREQAFGPEDQHVATTVNGLAILHWNQGQYDEAVPLFRRALAIWERTLGEDHLETAATVNNLAGVYRDQGEYDEAEVLYKRALEIRRKTLGADHPAVGYSLSNLAVLYRRQERYREAEPRYLQALEIWESSLGPEHPEVAFLLNNLALLYHDLGRDAEAEPASRRALEINRNILGHEHPSVASSLNILAIVLTGLGRVDQAAELHRQAADVYEQALGPEHLRVAWPLHGLANLYRDNGRLSEAEPLYKRALEIREQALGRDHETTREIVADYAAALTAAGRGEEAEALTAAQPAPAPQ